MISIEKKIFLIIILTLLVAIPVCSFFGFSIESNKAFIEVVENRQITVRDCITSSRHKAKAFEIYFSDMLAFRKLFIGSIANLYYAADTVLFKDKVIFGDNGFFYYGPSRPVFSGQEEYSEQQVLKMMADTDVIQKYLDEQDIPFLYIIAPDKEVVYPDYLPDWYLLSDKETFGETLSRTAEKEQETAYIVNAFDDLTMARTQYGDELFFKTDTHWSELGGYIGYRSQMEQLKTRYDYVIKEFTLDDYHIEYGDMLFGDLKNFDGLTRKISEFRVKLNQLNYDVMVNGESVNINEITHGTWMDSARFYNQNALNNQTLLLFGDSFTTSMLPFYIATFENVNVIHLDNTGFIQETDVLSEYIRQDHPDIVIMENVERVSLAVANKIQTGGLLKEMCMDECSPFYKMRSEDIENTFDIAEVKAVPEESIIIEVSGSNPNMTINVDGERNRHYLLKLKVEAPDNTLFELFYGKNGTFNSGSESIKLLKGENDINLALFSVEGFDVLRIGIGSNMPGKFYIDEFAIYEVF